MSLAEIIEIDDSGDVRLQRYANLRDQSVGSSTAAAFIVEGRWCVQRLIDSELSVVSAVVERGKEREIASWFAPETPVFSLPAETIRALVGYEFHRGVLACGLRPALKSIHQLQFAVDLPPLALAALGVAERDNLGSMIRTATALGIEHLLLGPNTTDPLSRRSIRVSMATVFRQHLYRLDQPELQLAQLQQTQNLRTIVTTLDSAATPLREFIPDDRPMVLVMGNEATGVEPRIEQLATDRVTIPMKLGTDSLNVSVAAAIFMHHLVNLERPAQRPR